MRQYYDVFSLLANNEVQAFIGTKEYDDHKKARFPKTDISIPISSNEAFILNDSAIREQFKKRYEATAKLYYKGQPQFEDLLARIIEHIGRM